MGRGRGRELLTPSPPLQPLLEGQPLRGVGQEYLQAFSPALGRPWLPISSFFCPASPLSTIPSKQHPPHPHDLLGTLWQEASLWA